MFSPLSNSDQILVFGSGAIAQPREICLGLAAAALQQGEIE